MLLIFEGKRLNLKFCEEVLGNSNNLNIDEFTQSTTEA